MWKTIETFMTEGGPVMWPLALMSMAGLAITIREAGRFALFSLSFDARRLHAVLDTLAGEASGKRVDVPAGADPVSRWFNKRLNDPDALTVTNLNPDDIAETGLWSLSFLATITAAAPLLGILGTVLGIIQSFSSLGGASVISEVSAGISQALVSTATGLVVAMSALLPHNMFAICHARWTHTTTVWARRLEKVIEQKGRSL